MRKKSAVVILLFALLLVFVACEKEYIPDPAVEEYLNGGLTADKAFKQIASAHYFTTEITANKAGAEQGKQTADVYFDLSDKDNLKLTMSQTFSGTYVTDGVTEQTTALEKSGDGYTYSVVTNVQSKNKNQQVTAEFALDLVTSLVYTDNGAYNEGGLYYGDLFMLRIYRFPSESFYVDTDKDLCVFDEKMRILRDDVGDVLLNQVTKINRLGLLISDYEEYESVDRDYVMKCSVSAEYEFTESDSNQQ
ncbi:MAG: hypothetical protein NC332_04700 [Firmicutes bacterium]|nr:hypothetical protein [Bacillota bacterium]